MMKNEEDLVFWKENALKNALKMEGTKENENARMKDSKIARNI
jgi:hypothetical protein